MNILNNYMHIHVMSVTSLINQIIDVEKNVAVSRLGFKHKNENETVTIH